MERELANLNPSRSSVVTHDWDAETKETAKSVTANSGIVDKSDKSPTTDDLEGVIVR